MSDRRVRVAGMVFAVEFTQGFITMLQKVVEIEFTPKVAETIVQDFVAGKLELEITKLL